MGFGVAMKKVHLVLLSLVVCFQPLTIGTDYTTYSYWEVLKNSAQQSFSGLKETLVNYKEYVAAAVVSALVATGIWYKYYAQPKHEPKAKPEKILTQASSSQLTEIIIPDNFDMNYQDIQFYKENIDAVFVKKIARFDLFVKSIKNNIGRMITNLEMKNIFIEFFDDVINRYGGENKLAQSLGNEENVKNISNDLNLDNLVNAARKKYYSTSPIEPNAV